MEHSLHLGAGHFVRGVAPTSSCEILKKAQHEDVDGAATGDDSEDEFEAADSIEKALALVNQVSLLIFKTFLHFKHLWADPQVTTSSSLFKSHVKRWTLRGFILSIGSGPDGVHCTIFLIKSSRYNKYVYGALRAVNLLTMFLRLSTGLFSVQTIATRYLTCRENVMPISS